MQSDFLSLRVSGSDVRIAYLRRPGDLAPLICLHGFGSTKEDYADLLLNPLFLKRDIILLDAPGFGASSVDDPAALSIPFLVDVALAACDALGVRTFHLSGHSMGGLTGLKLAGAHPERVLSFIDIEGNVAPEDCFLSRQIIEFPSKKPEGFFEEFIDRVSKRPEYASRLYSTSLRAKVRPSSIEPVFRSMVDISDNEPLMDMIGGLNCPRAFIYGEQNRDLSYLDHLPEIGVQVVEIPYSGHFPMYSNPIALWVAMASFLRDSESLLR